MQQRVSKFVKMWLFSSFLVSFLTLFTIVRSETSVINLGDVAFTILSQPHERHADNARRTKESLVEKLLKDSVVSPQVFVQHLDLPHHGGWTIFPLLASLDQFARKGTKWFVFLDESSEVNVENLKKVLSKYNQNYEFFVGKALTDPETTIIHHFSPVGLKYPDFKAGEMNSTVE